MAYRIDNATASSVMPTPGAVGPNVDGFFTGGNPSLSIPATRVDADWLNAFQEEICNVIEAASITLDKTEQDQLLQALYHIIQQGASSYAASTTAANTYTAILTPAPATYVEGMKVLIKFTNHNTGAATINLNSLGAKNIKRLDGSALQANDIADGMIALLVYDGTNFQLIGINVANFVTLAQYQNDSLCYATTSSSPNTYVASLSTAPASYTAGLRASIKFTNANTNTAPTINLNSLGAKTITRNDGSALLIGDIAAGMIADLRYDGTNFQLLNPFMDIYNALPNLVIGGEFTVNPWQRQTTHAAVSDGQYTADRFKWLQTGSGVVSHIRAGDAPTVANAGIFSAACLHVDVTTADSSIASSDIYAVQHAIEGYMFQSIAQRTFTLSFWVKSTKTGTFCVAFTNSGLDRSYVAEYTINASNTWEYKKITVTASPSGGTWTYNNNGAGIIISWVIAGGSTYQTTAGAWQAGEFYCTSSQVNGMDSASNDFKLQLIQVEPGSNATAFKAEPEQAVWSKCQRYYQKSYNFNIYPGATTLAGTVSYHTPQTNATLFGLNPRFMVSMRASPTVTYYSSNTGASGKIYNNGTAADQTVNSITGTGANCVGFPVLSAAASDTNSLYAQWVADSEI